MGLGKTIQAIAVAYYYKAEWPLLIIVPASLKFCWIEELEKWLPDILPNQINLIHCGTDASGIANSLITIVSYGLLRHPSSKVIKEAVEAQKFKIIICDESHYLKNNKTLSSKTIIPLLKAANRRILLSGTPALSKPVELYPQIDAICPGKFGTFWQFTDRYCDARTVFFGKFRKRQFDGASNLEELQQKLTSMLMIRREKSQVLTELPPKQRQRVLFELKESVLKKEILDSFAELRKKIRRGDKEVMKILETDELRSTDGEMHETENAIEKKDVNVFREISKLYKLSGDAKIGPVREYIEMLCDNEELKFLVFAYHHDMMNGVQQTLWEKKVKFVRIDGTTKSLDRQAYVTQFQSDPQTRVAILSILAAGVGLTFTSAKLVVFAELYWTPGVMVQCEDRAHRIGQTSSLPVHYLVARGTMDEWVWSAVCKKTIVTSTALTGHSKKLDHEEGDKYQIDLLSNAEVWQPKEDNTNVDVADLMQKHRPADQSSILHDNLLSPENKQDMRLVPENKVQKSNRNDYKMSASKKVKFTEILISSDEESEFQTPSIKRKTTNLLNKLRSKTSRDTAALNKQRISLKNVDQWSCSTCTFHNHSEMSLCEMCDTPKGKKNVDTLGKSWDVNKPEVGPEDHRLSAEQLQESMKLLAQTLSLLIPESAVTEDVVNVSMTRTDHAVGGTPPCTQKDMSVHKVFQFSCSSYTGRIYLYDQDGKSLDINFHPIDLEVGNFSELPDLLRMPQHQKLLQKFLKEWSSLSDTKKRLVAKRGLVFISPLSAFEEVKSVRGSKQRHLTKEDNMISALDRMRSVHGSVRVISKHSKVPTKLSQEPTDSAPSFMDCVLFSKCHIVTLSFQLHVVIFTITEAGVPVCLQCQRPYTNPLLSAATLRNPENAWQLRLCSYACMDKYWILTKAGYCRDQIYDIEHGICRLCHYDTHAIFTQIKIVKDFAARAKLVNASPYNVLTAKQKQKMVENPQAGQFWHLDHITPVWQGGGLCDLDNMRTLCTPCHLKVTRKQAGERANVKKLSGASRSGDITAFFQRH
ncbi:unnamed protein product [Lymnaea stagnalis]|uniref:Zinc finger RANBP2-type containing 3 n=1 Tax=Lymnaea stagnalis TaxID=6523 RepID=A0AAV2IKH3_LYMST